jgi:hypothetical protein
MTAVLNVRVEVEGYDAIVIRDVFSGSSVSGGRARSRCTARWPASLAC